MLLPQAIQSGAEIQVGRMALKSHLSIGGSREKLAELNADYYWVDVKNLG